MIPKIRRLTRNEISQVFKQGRVLVCPHMIVRFLKKTRGPKFTVTVETGVSRYATDRNVVKRRLRAALQRALVPPTPPVWGVVTATKRTKNASMKELSDELIATFQKIK